MNTPSFNLMFPETKRNPEFGRWMKRVDAVIQKRTGLTSDDLPDYCYADDFADGGTPAGAASRAIKAANEDF